MWWDSAGKCKTTYTKSYVVLPELCYSNIFLKLFFLKVAQSWRWIVHLILFIHNLLKLYVLLLGWLKVCVLQMQSVHVQSVETSTCWTKFRSVHMLQALMCCFYFGLLYLCYKSGCSCGFQGHNAGAGQQASLHGFVSWPQRATFISHNPTPVPQGFVPHSPSF